MAAVRKKLLTASDLATLCEVDLKTIHNWVDRGRISHFRTPGRHLRFRAADIVDFLRTWGYSVPRELCQDTARAVMVIGPPAALTLVSRVLGTPAPVIPTPSPSGVGLSPAGGRPARSEPPKAVDAGSSPLRHVAHPYDALIQIGAAPADVYVVDLDTLAAAQVPMAPFLDSLHRASPGAVLVALSDEAVALPSFVASVAHDDAHSLAALLAPPGTMTTSGPPVPADEDEEPISLAASSH